MNSLYLDKDCPVDHTDYDHVIGKKQDLLIITERVCPQKQQGDHEKMDSEINWCFKRCKFQNRENLSGSFLLGLQQLGID